jgi:hypothetical protein
VLLSRASNKSKSTLDFFFPHERFLLISFQAAAAAAETVSYKNLSPIEQAVWRHFKSVHKLGSLETDQLHKLAQADKEGLVRFNTTQNSKSNLVHDSLLRGVFGSGLLMTHGMLAKTDMEAIPFFTCEHGIE